MKLPLHSACRLLKSENGLVAVEKAAGVLSHPNRAADQEKSLLLASYDTEEEAYVEDDGQSWYLLNRLDSPTTGILLLATDREVAKAVRLAFAEGRVEKTYLALVKGIPRRPREVWRDCLLVERRGNALRTRVVRGAPNAITRVECICRGRGVPARSLLKLEPETGKTHQLRVQCAHRRCAIIGDANYGDFAANRDWQKRLSKKVLFLHSHRTRLDLKLPGRSIQFEATSPMPELFSIALQ